LRVEFLRYLRDSKGGWQFAGEYNAFQKDSPSHYRVTQIGDKPFLVISSDHSQNGVATQQVVEDWFDLTRQEFEPVFSATVDGGQWRFGFGVGRNLHAKYAITRTDGVERIELTLDVQFNGGGLISGQLTLASTSGTRMRRCSLCVLHTRTRLDARRCRPWISKSLPIRSVNFPTRNC